MHAQSCPPLCKPMNWGLPGSSIHGIFQARILEWLPFTSAGDLPDPGSKSSLLYLLHCQAESLPLHHLGNLITPTGVNIPSMLTRFV